MVKYENVVLVVVSLLTTTAESGVVVLVLLAVPMAVSVRTCAALSKQADPVGTMLLAKAVRPCWRLAVVPCPHAPGVGVSVVLSAELAVYCFLGATSCRAPAMRAVLETESTFCNVGGASCSSADPSCTVLVAEPTLVDRDGGAVSKSADIVCAMFCAK